MKVEWKMSPYLGVFPRVFSALRGPGEGGGQHPLNAAPTHGQPLPSPPCPGGRSDWGGLLTPGGSQPRPRARHHRGRPGGT